MAKNRIAKNSHILAEGDVMTERLAAIDKQWREQAIKLAIRRATNVVKKEFRRRVPEVAGYLKRKTVTKVSQADRWGRKWQGRIVAPHIHLFEAGFNHTGPKPDKTRTNRGRVEGRELIPKIKKQKRKEIADVLSETLKKAAEKNPNLRRKTRPR